MNTSQALEMINIPEKSFSDFEVWTDFGCGTGTFTKALAKILDSGSQIIAVDKDRNSLNQIPDQIDRVQIEKREADFLKINFPPETLDGILMANSLHYVRGQQTFIETVQQFLKPGGCFLIVEYNTDISNPWIPYPIDYENLKTVFANTGYSSVTKIKEKPSRYNRANLYSAVVWKASYD